MCCQRYWIQREVVDSRVRLDRGLATAPWLAQFPSASLSHFEAACSDHAALSLVLDDSEPKPTRTRQFKYESTWEAHEDPCRTVAQNSCNDPTVDDIKNLLLQLSGDLGRRERSTFESV